MLYAKDDHVECDFKSLCYELQCSYMHICYMYCFRLAAAQEAAAQAVQQQAGAAGAADRMGGASAAGGQGPTSLFLFSEENPIRRYTRFIIEWPYPFFCSCVILSIAKTFFLKMGQYPTPMQERKNLIIWKINTYSVIDKTY